MFIPLDLLQFQEQLRTQKSDGRLMIWCLIRRKWLVSNAEEVVRQLVLLFLINDRGYPHGLIQVEKELSAHGVSRRFDVLCYDKLAHPILLVECKAPTVNLDLKIAEQISNYNFGLQVSHLLITNGPKSCCWKIEATGETSYLSEVPTYKRS